jgi:uncharacterized protein
VSALRELTVDEHRVAVERVRERREEGLRDPMGWLSLVGLHWLQPGETSFGGGATSGIVLRAEDGECPPVAGTFRLAADGAVSVDPAPGVELRTAGGEPVPPGTVLVDDENGKPTVLALGSLRLYVIHRGVDRAAIRVKDVAAPALRTFTGLDYFPPDPAWRFQARFIAASPGETVKVPDIVGDVIDEPTPGVVELAIDGQTHRLRALEAQPGHLWLIFGDETNGHETYGGGRFLVSGPLQPDDSVEVDFNLAYNPPCVFSPYATCPLPPEGNRLPIRVEAGEQTPASGPEHRSTLPP